MYVPKKLARTAALAVKDPLSRLFPKQRSAAQNVVKHGSRTALQCGRRAGKTELFVHSAAAVMQRRAGAQIAYLALTRKSAKRILWPKLLELNDRLGLGLVPNLSDLTLTAPNGAQLHLLGADRANEIEKLRGQAWDLVGIDEAASFRRTLLAYLIRDVIDPALVDHDGSLALIGTPGAACTGYFHDACTGALGGWSHYHWTMLDNPFLPRAEQWLQRKRETEGWSEDNPTYLREYLGQWVLDEDSLVFRFSRDRNLIDAMPEGYAPGAPGWSHLVSIDYGYVDSTAWTVWAFRTDGGGDKRGYVVASYKWPWLPDAWLEGIDVDRSKGLLPTESAEITRRLQQIYRPWKMLGDAGGLGKPYIEEARRRYQVPVHPADKLGKNAQIELVNDGLRTARIVLLRGGADALEEELTQLQWTYRDHEVAVGGIIRHEERKDILGEDHCSDSFRYGYPDVRGHLNTRAPEPREEVYRRNPGERVRDEARGRAVGGVDSEWWDRD